MKIVGNCPCCGNPIYGKRTSAGMAVRDPLRTCFCPALKTHPVTIQIPPTYTPQPYPIYPTLPGGTWWCTTSPNQNVISTTANTLSGSTVTYTIKPPKPPDEDGALVT